MTTFIPVLLIFAILSTSLKCNKDKDTPPDILPPITQEGKNTFGCKINGEVWVPYYKCGGTGNPCGELYSDMFKLSQNQVPLEIHIAAGQRVNNIESYFSLESPLFNGIFTTGNKIDSIDFEYRKGLIQYNEIPGMGATNNIIITKLDTINKIISGTFGAVLYKSLTDSVKITEGRFDLKFAACKCSN